MSRRSFGRSTPPASGFWSRGDLPSTCTGTTASHRPLVPISAQEFADRELRETLIREKGMQMLQFWSDHHPETPVVFVREPFPFEEEYARATVKELASAGAVRIVSIATLIEMKEEAGRTEDRLDIEHLRTRLEEP